MRKRILPSGRGLKPTRREALSAMAASVAGISCSGEGGVDNALVDDNVMGTAGEALPPQIVVQPSIEIPTSVPEPMAATDRVMLGSTGIEISRLAIGSGSFGGGGTSAQMKLGVDSFATQLVEAYERGITFWETADQYGTHAHVGEALSRIGRENIVVLTKSVARSADEMKADLDRFEQELGTDQIDIILLHQCESAEWTTEREGAMHVLADAKQSGRIRAHGVSCHTLAAQELAAETEWVDVDLARINPFGIRMDGTPQQVVPVLDTLKAAGKGMIGMKILGLGAGVDRMDECLAYALNLSCLDAFTIGFASTEQLEEVMLRIASL